MRVVVIAFIVTRSAAFGTALAFAQEHDHSTSAPAADVPVPTMAHRLWHDLVCLCGECDRLTLAACQCPTAARERENILAALRSRGLSSDAQSEAAYQAVVNDYARRHDGKDVFRAAATTKPSRSWIGWTLVGVWLAMIAGAALSAMRVRRRRSAKGLPRRTPRRRRE